MPLSEGFWRALFGTRSGAEAVRATPRLVWRGTVAGIVELAAYFALCAALFVPLALYPALIGWFGWLLILAAPVAVYFAVRRAWRAATGAAPASSRAPTVRREPPAA